MIMFTQSRALFFFFFLPQLRMTLISIVRWEVLPYGRVKNILSNLNEPKRTERICLLLGKPQSSEGGEERHRRAAPRLPCLAPPTLCCLLPLIFLIPDSLGPRLRLVLALASRAEGWGDLAAGRTYSCRASCAWSRMAATGWSGRSP